MGLQDLIVTPIYLILFTVLAYFIRPYVTNKQTRKYFLPALWTRFVGAIGLGLVYQFYYEGGDTFNYWTHGSEWIWKAFMDNPLDGFRLLTKMGPQHVPNLYQYSQHIWYYRDPASFFVIRIATIFDLLTFHTYSSTALLFAILSFSGIWALFSALQKKYPNQGFSLALGVLFFPSLIFWGSGILKDSITLSALCWMTWALLKWFDFRERSFGVVMVFVLSFWVLASVKVYILICFLPVVIFWIFLMQMGKIKNSLMKVIIGPLLTIVFLSSAYFTTLQIGLENQKYSLDNIAERARITSYDIRYGWGARLGGDGGYDLGELDGSWISMIMLAPAAINVSLFRPYLWEVKNPLMLFGALESLILIVLTFKFFIKNRWRMLMKDPFLIFCLIFSLLFAFAVGVSTYNFGTLMRYKLPIIPFLAILLFVDFNSHEKFKKG